MSIFKSEKGGKSGEESKINFAEVLRDQAEASTIKEANFADIYGEKEVQKDIKWCKDQRATQAERARKEAELNNRPYFGDIETRDAYVQEFTVMQGIWASDWFHEYDRPDELDPDGELIDVGARLTSEFDDRKNHVDIIVVVNNKLTDGEPLPFAIDTTFNTDNAGLEKKMSWTHYKTHTPGAASLKYYEADEDNVDPEVCPPKGRIDMMPRFVVGFDPQLAIDYSKGKISGGWGAMRVDEFSAKMKWCILKELKSQTGQMLKYYEKHHDTPELQELQRQVGILDQYFAGAIKAARSGDSAKWEDYANRDEVCNEITSRSIMPRELQGSRVETAA